MYIKFVFAILVVTYCAYMLLRALASNRVCGEALTAANDIAPKAITASEAPHKSTIGKLKIEELSHSDSEEISSAKPPEVSGSESLTDLFEETERILNDDYHKALKMIDDIEDELDHIIGRVDVLEAKERKLHSNVCTRDVAFSRNSISATVAKSESARQSPFRVSTHSIEPTVEKQNTADIIRRLL